MRKRFGGEEVERERRERMEEIRERKKRKINEKNYIYIENFVFRFKRESIWFCGRKGNLWKHVENRWS